MKRTQNFSEPGTKKPKENLTNIREREQELLAIEKSFGIEKFIKNFGGFGLIKQNYFDFIVNEIDMNGNVVILTDTKIQIPKKEVVEKTSISGLSDFYNPEILTQIEEFEKLRKGEMLLPKETDKERRSSIHKIFKTTFATIESDTVDGQIRLRFKRDMKGPQRSTWPANQGHYLEFVVCKSNMDNNHLINELSAQMGLKSKAFAIAGTKDKKAITTQKVTVYKTPLEKFVQVDIPNVELGNFKFVSDQIKLGDLKGNRFSLVLRQVEDVKEEAIKEVSSKGFINYYGLQRFGYNAEIPTFLVGIHLLQGKWEHAVRSFLAGQSNTEMGDLMKQYDAKEITIKDVYDKMPRFLRTERDVIYNYITVGESDHYNAFHAIPRNLRVMFVHSFQSYVWNRVASARIEKYGLSVVVGDLVSKEDVEEKCHPVLVTEENIKDFDAYDVVLPTPGTDVKYPTHSFNVDYYIDMMAKDGIEMKMFENEIKTYMCYGNYRKILSRADDIKYHFLKYESENKPLTDNQGVVLESEGTKNALVIQFNLKTSAYATMFIRELLHFPSYSGM